MEEKICPLLLMGNPSNVGGRANCKGNVCGWWWCNSCALVEIAQGCNDIQTISDILMDMNEV